MSEGYYVDLGQFSMERFKQILENGEILPSRMILKEKISERFTILQAMGIRNLKELIDALSSKKKICSFSEESGLPQEYLEILKRQTGIYTSKPLYFKDIPGIPAGSIEQLATIGIRQTKQLFERAKSRDDRAKLARLVDVPDNVLLELVKISDLARAGWVGPIFARLIYETGVDTLEKLSRESPKGLYEKLLAINREQKLTKASFSVKDIASCIEIAKELPKAIEY